MSFKSDELSKKLTSLKIFLSMIFFAAFWEIMNIIGWNDIFSKLKNFYGNYLYRDFQRILQFILCFFIVRYYNKKLKFNIKNMFSKFDLKLFLKWAAIILLLNLFTMFIIYKRFNINTNRIFTIFDCLIIGLSEEFVFRGWIFNSLYSVTNYKKANVLQSLYFMVFHWIPFITIWFINGSINIDQLQCIVTWNTVTVFLGGWIFGYLFKKSESITLVMLLHALIDYSAFLFYMS